MNCPKCNCDCWRDSVDVGVGILHGPWGCPDCGWSEDPSYDCSEGTSPEQQKAGSEKYVDQFGGITSVSRIVERCEHFGIPGEIVREAFEI